MGRDFSLAWRVLNAQYFGVAQRRRRVFLVADFGGQSAPKILFEQYSMSGNTSQSESKREKTTRTIERSIRDTSEHECNQEINSVCTSSSSQSNTKYEDTYPTLFTSRVPEASLSYCVAGNIINRKIKNGGNRKGFQENISYTLNTSDKHVIYCTATQQGGAETLKNVSPTITESA